MKKKIAESIIIRVGGGIREIRREPIEILDGAVSVLSLILNSLKIYIPFGPPLDKPPTISKVKITN